MLDRTLTIASIGLHPPVPPELRADFATATEPEQKQHRMKYASRFLRWSRICGAVLAVLLVKEVWNTGALESAGLGAGIARASELQQVAGQVAAMRWENRRDKLEATVRALNAEEVQLLSARADYNARAQAVPEFISTRLGALGSERDAANLQLKAMAEAEAQAAALAARKKSKAAD